jgi:hypothetical protein
MKQTLLALSGFFFIYLLAGECSAQDNRLWSTYYGSIGNDGGFTTTTDDSGNVYLAGITNSPYGMAWNGFQNTFGGGNVDAYLAKFNPAGILQWATYYGGGGNEMAFFGGKIGIAADHEGSIYLAGLTNSTTGIASNGFQDTISGTLNAYLVKFNAGGNREWATYYGGTFANGYAVAVDASNNVYLAGTTGSSTGVAFNGHQNTWAGSNDAFLVKFEPDGNRVWATYYGGTSMDEGYAVTTDASGNVFLAGHTVSTSGISFNGYQNTFGGGSNDAFLVKFDSAGTRLWATYFGDIGDELFMFSSDMGIATDAGGNIYMTGSTNSTTNIAFNGYQNIYGGGSQDAYLVKFSPNGTRIWATYYGDNDIDKAYNVDVDNAGNIFIAGRTSSAANIASAGFQNIFGGVQDAFLVKFNSEGIRLCATYYGEVGYDDCNSVAVDNSGNVYVAGGTENASGIAVGGHQTVFGGGTSDGMLIKFTTSCGTTNVAEALDEYSIEIYPNPASEVIEIKSAYHINALVEIFNAQGKAVYVGEMIGRSNRIELGDFSAGIYFARVIHTGSQTSFLKFSVIK